MLFRRLTRRYLPWSVVFVRLIITGLTIVVLLAGCGSSEPADEAVQGLVEALSESEYDTAYEMLHPAHQRVVAEELFIECGEQAEIGGTARVDEYNVTGETKRDRTITELGDVEVTEVGVNLVQGNQTFYRTWDVVKDDGEWRWILSNEDLEYFREGRCPGQAASTQP